MCTFLSSLSLSLSLCIISSIRLHALTTSPHTLLMSVHAMARTAAAGRLSVGGDVGLGSSSHSALSFFLSLSLHHLSTHSVLSISSSPTHSYIHTIFSLSISYRTHALSSHSSSHTHTHPYRIHSALIADIISSQSHTWIYIYTSYSLSLIIIIIIHSISAYVRLSTASSPIHQSHHRVLTSVGTSRVKRQVTHLKVRWTPLSPHDTRWRLSTAEVEWMRRGRKREKRKRRRERRGDVREEEEESERDKKKTKRREKKRETREKQRRE